MGGNTTGTSRVCYSALGGVRRGNGAIRAKAHSTMLAQRDPCTHRVYPTRRCWVDPNGTSRRRTAWWQCRWNTKHSDGVTKRTRSARRRGHARGGGGGGTRPPPSRLCGTAGQSTPVAGTVRWPPRPGSLAVELAPAQGVRQAPPEGCRAPARRPRPQPQGLPGPAGKAALTLHRPAPTAAPAAGTHECTHARTQQSGDARNKVVVRATRWWCALHDSEQKGVVPGNPHARPRPHRRSAFSWRMVEEGRLHLPLRST